MSDPTDVIYVGGMQRSCRDRALPFAMPAQVFPCHLPFDAPVCRSCGSSYYPEILRSPASEDYDHGQFHVDVCGRCQRLRFQRLDLMAARPVRP